MKLFQPDSELPGIETVLCPKSICKLVGTAGLEISNIRYKPGIGCLVAYRNALGSKNGIATLHAKSFRSSEWPVQKRKIENKAGVNHVVLIDELCVAIIPFPFDSELPSLLKLHQEPNSIWSRIVNDSSRFHEATSLAYKPNRRFTARIQTQEGKFATVKLYGEPEYKSTVARLKNLKSNSISLPVEIGHSDRHCAIAFQWIEGEPFSLNHLTTSSIKHFVEQLAEQESQFKHLESKTKHIGYVDYAFLNSIEIYLSHIHPPTSEGLRPSKSKLTSYLNSSLRTSEFPQFAHGDFHPAQILIDKNGTPAVCDFDSVCFASPEHDWGNFLGHVEYLALIGTYPIEFLHAFQESICSLPKFQSADSKARLDFETICGLYRLATNPFRSGFENWETVTAKVVRRISELSNGLEIPASRTVSSPSKADLLNDNSFSFLSSALDAKLATSHLKDVEELVQEFGDFEVTKVSVSRLKPSRRCLIEFCINSKAGPNRFLGKASSRKLKRRSAKNQRRLYGEFGFNRKSEDGVSVPKTFGECPDWKMWFQEKVNGKPIANFLNDPNSFPEVSKSVVKAIAKLHKCGMQVKKQHTVNDEVAILTKQWERAPIGLKTTKVEKLLNRCREVAKSNWASCEPHLIHRDFYQDQIIIGERRCWLVDLDLLCMGDSELDIANFVAHLRELGIRKHCNPRHFEEFESSFVGHYSKQSPSFSPNIFSAYLFLSLVRHIFISNKMHSRKNHTLQIVNECVRISKFD